jgi:deazaflavin-dependent oxidoreductase (nitroreductase family)
MTGNDFISWVLRSSLHSMLSNNMLLITVTGRKTDRQYTTPVEYFSKNGYLFVMTSCNRTWWRNLKDGAEVSLLLKRKPVHALAELELDKELVEALLVEYLQYLPRAAKPLSIRIENGNVNAEDVARVANDRLFVRLQLTSQ